MRNRKPSGVKAYALAAGGAVLTLCVWVALAALRLVPESVFPSPTNVARAFLQEAASGRLWNDIVVSLFRVSIGFGLAVSVGVPLGLMLGHHRVLREAVSPGINFFRSLSPLAWIPFAILWFGVGDLPAIFLIFLASVFPLILATMVAVLGIPSVYFRVAYEHGITGWDLMWQVIFPAVLPQVITALRVTAGLAWLVVVAAEMVAGRDGLGFAILDARNGLRTDLVVVGMIVIGCIGIVLDRVLANLTQIPSVRWGYER